MHNGLTIINYFTLKVQRVKIVMNFKMNIKYLKNWKIIGIYWNELS